MDDQQRQYPFQQEDDVEWPDDAHLKIKELPESADEWPTLHGLWKYNQHMAADWNELAAKLNDPDRDSEAVYLSLDRQREKLRERHERFAELENRHIEKRKPSTVYEVHEVSDALARVQEEVDKIERRLAPLHKILSLYEHGRRVPFWGGHLPKDEGGSRSELKEYRRAIRRVLVEEGSDGAAWDGGPGKSRNAACQAVDEVRRREHGTTYQYIRRNRDRFPGDGIPTLDELIEAARGW